MKMSIARTHCWRLVLMGILLLVAAVLAPGPAGATLMEYTYTGTTLSPMSGVGFPESPDLGTYVTITFKHDGLIPASGVTITEFTMSCGELELSSAQWPGIATNGAIWATDMSGTPTEWTFQVSYIPEQYGWEISSYRQKTDSGDAGYVFLADDRVRYKYPNGTTMEIFTETPGIWSVTAVPIPPSVLLLGSGLIPLVLFRRKRRSVE